MSLEQWFKFGWIKKHKTSKQEIDALFEIIERDLKDSKESNVSNDWRFGIAYNAALKLCTILLNASGYRANSTSAHHYTINALPLILGDDKKTTQLIWINAEDFGIKLNMILLVEQVLKMLKRSLILLKNFVLK